MTRSRFFAAWMVALVIAGSWPSHGHALQEKSPGEWTYFGASESFTRYSPLDQIDQANVSDLEILWKRPSIDPEFAAEYPELSINYNFRSTPIYVDGVLYAPNGVGLVEAMDPATGGTIWLQEPRAAEEAQGQTTRGVVHWSGAEGGRILSVRGEYLYALDARTGEEIESFGEEGRVKLTPVGADRFHWSSGPIVVEDVIVVAGNSDGAGDSGTSWRGSPSEDVRGYDIRSGRLLWTFHAVPREGEFGTDTWENESWRDSGDLGSWCCLSADEELGYVYVPLTAPTAAYYGGHRPSDNLFSNSLVALDARTGERVWHFQLIHHDVWEFDVVGPPTLGEITVDGREIQAVMQPAKTGWVYVFDRATGEPVWPIIERPVPASSVPGEELSPTQPFPTKPAPFDTHGVTPDDLIDFTPELHARAVAIADSFKIGPIFTPPSIVSREPGGTKGTLAAPGSWGSGNWNTGAFDPETGMYYAVSHTYPRVYRIEPTDDSEAEMSYWSPNREAPSIEGLPIIKPPWGRITAIDMDTGEHVWMTANGDGPREHPLLESLDVPPLGVPSRAAPLVTGTLLFLSEGNDVTGSEAMEALAEGRMFRAYDKGTGEVVWEIALDAGSTGAPMSYFHDGKQYIVVAIGDRNHDPQWVALGLP